MAYKTFTAGTLALASDINTYLMNQTVMVFADATARNAALTSPTEGMVTYQTGSDHLTVYNGSAWIPFDTTWNTYTPTIAGITLGSGYTLSAAYAQIGKTIAVQFSLLFGATTTITGDVSFSLPVNHASSNRSAAAGTAVVVDASPATRYTGSVLLSGTPGYAYIRVQNAAGTYVTNVAITSTTPIAVPAVNDQISATIVYQAA